jgi:hypothetical protein
MGIAMTPVAQMIVRGHANWLARVPWYRSWAHKMFVSWYCAACMDNRRFAQNHAEPT